MVAHPEAEWIWWVDSDAVFTDMDFKLPLDKYKNHNFVIYGWPKLIYEKKSWTGMYCQFSFGRAYKNSIS